MKTSALTILIIFVILAGLGYVLIQRSSKNTSSKQIQATKSQSTGNVKEFVITARQWQYDPPEIRVKQGDRVRIRAKSVDVVHGLMLPQFNINMKLDPNSEVSAEFITDKKGQFDFFCNVSCGQGHRDMKGIIVVE